MASREREFLSKFENMDSSSIFKEIGKQLPSERSRSLWNRMQSELQTGGVRSVVSYLDSTLNQKIEKTREILDRFKEGREN